MTVGAEPGRRSLALPLRLSRAVDPEAERRALMALVRNTGAQGGRIDPHRSIATIDLTVSDVLLATALATAVLALYVASLEEIGRAWTAVFRALAGPLGIAAGVGTRATTIASVAEIVVPFYEMPARAPGAVAWWVTFAVTVGVLGATVFMRNRLLPLGYALRFAAAVQVTALAFFAIAPARFPYDLPSYVSGMMLLGAILIGVVPIVYGLTFYLVDVGWSRKLLLTVLTMGHLLVLVPLQYVLQSVVIAHASLIVLPLLFILFGMLPGIMVLVAMFGWGMSWRSLGRRGSRQ